VSAEFRRVLDALGTSLMGGTVLVLEHDYQQRSAFCLGLLAAMAAEQAEGGVANLVEENRALRVLFADAAEQVADAVLADRLRVAAAEPDPGLRLSELATANRALRALLIALHAHVETLDGPEARLLEERIWSELVAGNARRRLTSAPM
jgi:hypothetical protein